MYVPDLLCLDACRPTQEHQCQLLSVVTTPLLADEWERSLARHPDQAFAGYICRGLREGFRIGFKREVRLKSTNRNMESALQHPEVVTEYIEKECALGRMLGPFPTTEGLPLLHISRFGVIPKGHNTGKFRLITDLSHPAGNSINDGVDPHLCSLTYTSVEEVAAEASRSGQGALLAKVDIEAAYRLVPVHPQDRVLQAVKWDDAVFIDPTLPFGLRSAPKIFNAVADALQWHLIQAGVERLFHYLDDYILVGPPRSQVCQSQLQILLEECARLGVPIADHKTEGPATEVTFLGIVIDTVKGELRLPQDKLTRLTSLLAEWQARKNCTRKELESLVGLLNHACKVVRPGRPFLRRMIDLLQAVHRPPNSRVPIRLAHGFRADLAWWVEFVVQWNGTSFLHPPSSLPKVHLYTDASGSWGCGAWYERSWFQVKWDARAEALSIAEKELIPIIVACQAWGEQWKGLQVICHSDNQSVVADLKSRSSRHKGMMHLLRTVVFAEARLVCSLSPVYIDTRANHLADSLSRDNAVHFLSQVQSADPRPSPVSPQLLDLLLDQTADWSSPNWRQHFGATFRQA